MIFSRSGLCFSRTGIFFSRAGLCCSAAWDSGAWGNGLTQPLVWLLSPGHWFSQAGFLQAAKICEDSGLLIYSASGSECREVTLAVSPVVFHSVMSLPVSLLVLVLDLQQESCAGLGVRQLKCTHQVYVLGHVICVLCISNRNDILFIHDYFLIAARHAARFILQNNVLCKGAWDSWVLHVEPTSYATK